MQKECEVSFTLHIVSWIECKYQEYHCIKSTIIIVRQGFNICNSNCFNWLHFNSFPFFLPSVSSSFLPPWYSFFQFTSLSFHSPFLLGFIFLSSLFLFLLFSLPTLFSHFNELTKIIFQTTCIPTFTIWIKLLFYFSPSSLFFSHFQFSSHFTFSLRFFIFFLKE